MAKGAILGGPYTGKVGDNVFFVRNGEQIVRSYVPSGVQRNPRTESQMQTRVRLANVLNVYKSFNGTLKDCFEAKRNGQSDYNRFMSVNLQSVPVCLTRTLVEQSACVAAPYLVSQGSLPEISVTGTDETAYTNIRLGDLTITETTTVAEFAKAVVGHNASFEYYDQLSYYSMLQMISPEGIPFVRCTQARVDLHPMDGTALLDIAPSYGFSTNNGFLGHGEYIGQGAFCWMQARNSCGRLLVSSQRLVVNNDLLTQYTAPQAKAAAMRSYGVQPGAFIRPDQ